MAAGGAWELKRYDKVTGTKLYSVLADQSTNLANEVDKGANPAADILSQVAVYMRQYTLHTERHVLNVIARMERILTPDGIGKLSPPELALGLISAYVHDLGMALTREEHANTLDDKGVSESHLEFARSCTGLVEERAQIERLRANGRPFVELVDRPGPE